ncbi:MAG: hypothetical protein IPJ81_09165 [Chitinophagaceae bacterium]|nr:hypothetical protein [Chitinophagaceae bacterium]
MSSTAGSIYGSNGLTFYDIAIASSASITAGTNFNVEHNLTNNGGVIDASVGKIVFTGSSAGTINGSSGTYDLAQFDVNKATSIAVTLSSNLTNATAVNVVSGILDLTDKTISQNSGSSGTNQLAVYANALLKIGSTNTLPAIGNYTLDSLSTVEYYGGNQTVSVAATYGNLTLSTGGTKLAPSAITMKNNFTLSAATFDAASYTHTVGGNWTMSSGTFSNQGTIVFNGTAVQGISSTGAFNNMTINKTSGYIDLATDVTAGGTVTFTLGKIYTNANKLIMGTGTVSGADQSTGWVNGNLQKMLEQDPIFPGRLR